ncbi:hypothetical protein IJ182_07920 [bacterium]|nr:hypothetical protein [bacterium]
MSELIPETMAIHKPKTNLLKIINNKSFNDKVLYETQSAFHNIKIIENEIGRFLHYSDTYQAGLINTNYYQGNLPYINYFLIPYLINPNIEKILLIGLGSGKIVNDIEVLFKKLKKIDVVDLEENITDIAQNYFGFKPSNKFNFILQDGLTYLFNNKTKYDLIIVDVANNEGIDTRFLSPEYFTSIKKSLKKSGIFVSNMCASPDFEHPKNYFMKQIFPIYNEFFRYNHLFKGNYSDEVYYKAFFNIDERVIDITNVIIISTDNYKTINTTQNLINDIAKLNINIENYLKDLYQSVI